MESQNSRISNAFKMVGCPEYISMSAKSFNAYVLHKGNLKVIFNGTEMDSEESYEIITSVDPNSGDEIFFDILDSQIVVINRINEHVARII